MPNIEQVRSDFRRNMNENYTWWLACNIRDTLSVVILTWDSLNIFKVLYQYKHCPILFATLKRPELFLLGQLIVLLEKKNVMDGL